MDYTYKLHKDIYKDAWNWWDACNSMNFNVDWSKKIDKEVAKKIKGKNRNTAYGFIIPFLREKYTLECELLSDNFNQINNDLDAKYQLACKKIVKIMSRPLYKNKIEFFLTTFPSLTVDQQRGYIWLNYYWKEPIETFLHEVCHMQFTHYWRENPKSPIFKLSENQFELIKESLTIILDQDFYPLISREDEGYLVHKDFRNQLKTVWHEDKDFDHLVNFATTLLYAAA